MSKKQSPRVFRTLIPLVALAGLLALSLLPCVAQADELVAFPDTNLEAAIREAIGKPVGDIHQSDLDGLSDFGGDDQGIVDLTGLEHCTNLSDLSLPDNQISSLSPLSGLSDLTYLDLGGNKISNLSPLSGIAGLTYLGLGGNRISNLSPLSRLTNLAYLDLGGNKISNLSPLSGIAGLEELYLNDNRIGDLSPLSGLTNLTCLDLGSNQISGLSALSYTTKLTYLGLNGNQISDLSPLSGLTNLTYLDLGSNQISDLSPLSRLVDLAYLDLGSNQVSNLSPLSSLANVTHLDLGSNQVSDVSPLSGLMFLDWLGLVDNQISDIEPLVNNTKIDSGDRVDLRGNPLNSNSLNSGISHLEARGVEVVRQDAPPAVITNAAADIGDTWVTLTGDLASLGTAASVEVCFEWGVDGAYDNTTTPQIMTDPGTFGTEISHLTSGMTYCFRAKAAGDGTSYGAKKSFSTDQGLEVKSAHPDSGKREQHLTVVISGTDFDGATFVDFGSGITVEDFTVNSSTEITAEISIDADAAKGTRDVSVTTDRGTKTKTDGFSVVDGRGGICSTGALTTPAVPSEMTTTLAAVALLLGVGRWLAGRSTGNRRASVRG